MFVAACVVFVATKTSVFRCGQNWFDQHCLYLWRDYFFKLIRHSGDEQQSSNEQNAGKTGKQKPPPKNWNFEEKMLPISSSVVECTVPT